MSSNSKPKLHLLEDFNFNFLEFFFPSSTTSVEFFHKPQKKIFVYACPV